MKDFLKKIWRFIWKSVIFFLILSITTAIIYRWLPIPITPLMLIRCVEQKAENKDIKLEKDWVAFEEISQNLQLAVVCSEDQNFIIHRGFDFTAIEKAMEYNSKHRKQRGASTISQQTAKNVFLWPGRSWIRKGFEVYFVFLIETLWSKERIMEVYLNVIEIGDGVYGAQAAALIYFNKNAAYLTKAEAALIAAVLPNPLKFSVAKPSSYIRYRQNWIIRQIGLWGGTLNYEVPVEKVNIKKKRKRKAD